MESGYKNSMLGKCFPAGSCVPSASFFNWGQPPNPRSSLRLNDPELTIGSYDKIQILITLLPQAFFKPHSVGT